MFKYRRNRVLALCAGERRLLTMALLSFRNKLVASGKPTEDINELLIRLLRYCCPHIAGYDVYRGRFCIA